MNEDHNNDFVRFRTTSVYELMHDVIWIYGELETFQEASVVVVVVINFFKIIILLLLVLLLLLFIYLFCYYCCCCLQMFQILLRSNNTWTESESALFIMHIVADELRE